LDHKRPLSDSLVLRDLVEGTHRLSYKPGNGRACWSHNSSMASAKRPLDQLVLANTYVDDDIGKRDACGKRLKLQLIYAVLKVHE
jgi:hypothetical protein